MKRILIVGKNFSGLKQSLEEKGFDYLTLQDRLATKFPDKKFKKRVTADFASRETIVAALDEISEPIDAVMTIYENYILAAAWVAEHLKLPGMPPESAEACTDKELMRTLFATSPEPISPDFAVIDNEETLRRFADDHEFPLIIKPANLSKSLLVSKSRTLEELLKNYRAAMNRVDEVYRKYAPNRQPKLLVEDFLEGSIHSVDAFVDKNGKPHILPYIVDYVTGYDIGYNDNFHYARLLPSKLNSVSQDAILHTAALGCKVLGMKSSPAHIEIILTPKGPRIVEIGARNGGYRERMHKIANDLDLPAAALALAFGDKPEITGKTNYPCAVLELFPKTPGIFTGIQNQVKLEALKSLNYFAIKQTIGKEVGSSSDGYKMCAIIILSNHDPEQFAKDLAYVNDEVCATTTQ